MSPHRSKESMPLCNSIRGHSIPLQQWPEPVSGREHNLMMYFLVAKKQVPVRNSVLSYQPPILLAAGEMSVSALGRVAGQSTTCPLVNQQAPTSSSPKLLIQNFRRRENFFLGDVNKEGIPLSGSSAYCPCDGGGGGHVIDKIHHTREGHSPKGTCAAQTKKKGNQCQ